MPKELVINIQEEKNPTVYELDERPFLFETDLRGDIYFYHQEPYRECATNCSDDIQDNDAIVTVGVTSLSIAPIVYPFVPTTYTAYEIYQMITEPSFSGTFKGLFTTAVGAGSYLFSESIATQMSVSLGYPELKPACRAWLTSVGTSVSLLSWQFFRKQASRILAREDRESEARPLLSQ